MLLLSRGSIVLYGIVMKIAVMLCLNPQHTVGLDEGAHFGAGNWELGWLLSSSTW
jgi:hypothetical protein